jgi:hypothetical protein
MHRVCFVLLAAGVASAGSIYITGYEYNADLNVYVADYEYQAEWEDTNPWMERLH